MKVTIIKCLIFSVLTVLSIEPSAGSLRHLEFSPKRKSDWHRLMATSEPFTVEYKNDSFIRRVLSNTLRQIDYLCAGQCDPFILMTFKNNIFNSRHWTENFNKKLKQDLDFAITEQCAVDANIFKFVETVSGRSSGINFSNPSCAFNRVESLNPKIPKTKPSSNTYYRGGYHTISSHQEDDLVFVGGRPFRNFLAATDYLLTRTRKATVDFLTGGLYSESGIDVGGGKFGASYVVSTSSAAAVASSAQSGAVVKSSSGIDVGGGKYAPSIENNSGIDVGGGKYAPSAENNSGIDVGGGKVQPEALTMTQKLLKNRENINRELSKLSVYRDVLKQKQQGNDFEFNSFSSYWSHYGIVEKELQAAEAMASAEELNQKIKELEKERREIEKQLNDVTYDGDSYFTEYDKDRINREFIYLMSRKILEGK